jgi:hypothetical protein
VKDCSLLFERIVYGVFVAMILAALVTGTAAIRAVIAEPGSVCWWFLTGAP